MVEAKKTAAIGRDMSEPRQPMLDARLAAPGVPAPEIDSQDETHASR